MDKRKKPYKLSVWEDRWDAEKQCYTDVKIVDIASSEDKKPHQATNVMMSQNVNGTSTLSFTLYYRYKDPVTGKDIDNPFISLLTNERKIKINYAKEWDFASNRTSPSDNNWIFEWKDFFIKTAVESSDKRSITYTCKDAFITELSKNGYAIELDSELMNNQGTVTELAETVLADTDWQVEDGTIIRERLEDYVYEVEVLNTFSANDAITDVSTSIPSGSTILVYYDNVMKEEPRLQFLYDEGSFKVDDQRIVDASEYIRTNITYDTSDSTVTKLKYDSTIIAEIRGTVSDRYKGMRLIYKPKTRFDPVTGKNVVLHTYENETIYGYEETEFLEPLTVTNYVTNGKNMVDASGWYPYANSATTLLPTISSYVEAQDASIFLEVGLASGQTRVLNTSVSDHRSHFKYGIVKGDAWTLRMKYKRGSMTGSQTGLTAVVAQYDVASATYQNSNRLFIFSSGTVKDGYVEFKATAQFSVSQKELFLMSSKVGLFLISNSAGVKYYLEDIQLFKTVYDDKSNQIYPDTIDMETLARTVYKYYYPLEVEAGYTKEDVEYIYQGNMKLAGAVVQYDNTYERVRSITASKSNCFNLIQELAETFECWALFEVEHEANGQTKLVQDGDGQWHPKKTVRFVELVGQEKSLGFRYGFNLSSIQRNVESEQIVTKLIVEKNSNEFAENGFCTISDADDNLARESFLLNLDYFSQKGLIDGNELLRDLYITTGESKGYLPALRDINLEIGARQNLLPGIYRSEDQQNYLLELYGTMYEESKQLRIDAESAILQLTKLTNLNSALKKVAAASKTSTEYRYYTEYSTYKRNEQTAQDIMNKAESGLSKVRNQLIEIENAVKEKVEEKRRLNLKFYKRYSRFIQEGSWIDEDYLDPNLYYLDAQSVLYNSAFPQVKYTINVVDLSGLEQYRHYTYGLGDRTTIEDVEFFGYSDYATKTPYKEEVIISEITTNFDNPQSDKITIQNFKSQFQDLFQRITATTNSLQYNTGAYKRASNVVDENGEIKLETLQNSLINNSLTIASAQNESFIIDSNGITAVDLDNPLNLVKLQSKGLFLSTDGGITWKLGIRGSGINTEALTAGSILVDRIFIQGSGSNSFRWDENGINAFSNLPGGGGRNLRSFVRFDNYGIYGINNTDITLADTPFIPEDELDIWDSAQFGLTWKGLFVKNRYDTGMVEVSSENDVSIWENEQLRVKLGEIRTGAYGLVVKGTEGEDRIVLGSLSSQGGVSTYGLKITDSQGNVGMYTNDAGELYAQRMNIGPTSYSPRAKIGVLEEYIDSININDIEVYDSLNLYQPNDIVSYVSKYYQVISTEPTSSVPTSGDWTEVEVNRSKILSVHNDELVENITLYDDGYAEFKNINIEGGTVTGQIIAKEGNIGDLTINEEGLSGYGFSLGFPGLHIDATENEQAFRIYKRVDNVFYPEFTYHIGDIVLHEGVRYQALEDIIYDGSTPLSPPNVDTINWEQSEGLDSRTLEQDLFSIVNEELVMRGSGTFSGEVQATSGFFSGSLNANSGYVGGLILGGNSLYTSDSPLFNPSSSYQTGDTVIWNGNRYRALVSLDEYPVPSEDSFVWELTTEEYGLGDAPFSVDGSGHVVANKITLGNEAEIADYIKLGSAYIYNPLVYQDNFITVFDEDPLDYQDAEAILNIKSDGTMRIGKDESIIIDGRGSFISGRNWSITPSLASFDNVSVSGSIKTAIFEKESVQSMSSVLVLATTNKIVEYDNVTHKVTIEVEGGVDSLEYRINDYVLVADNSNNATTKIISIDLIDIDSNLVYLELEDTIDLATMPSLLTITRIGKDGDFQLGINASETVAGGIFLPRAITMSELEVADDKLNYRPKVILGKLTNNIDGENRIQLPDGYESVYGLYADFAYLRGSIVTEVPFSGEEVTYAGLSTLHGVLNNGVDNGFGVTDTSQIVLWAGAKSAKPEDIQNAFFKVTAAGYIYAEQGMFKGSVLSDSIITDSIIVTSMIGIPEGSDSLYIYDTDASGGGIVFAHLREMIDDEPQFDRRVGLDKDGLRFYAEGERAGLEPPLGIYVPDGDGSRALLNINGEAFLSRVYIGKQNFPHLNIESSSVKYWAAEQEGSDALISQMSFSSTRGIVFEYGQEKLIIGNAQTVVRNTLNGEANFILGEQNSSRLTYEKVANGYDLYVSN